MGECIRIGIIGDFDGRGSHLATNEALKHASERLHLDCTVNWLPTEALETGTGLNEYDGLWCAPGLPYKSEAGALKGIRYARENGIPFLGTCGGFQHTVIEYARNVLALKGACHAETDPAGDCHVITALSCSLIGEPHGIYLVEGTRTQAIYGKARTQELFTCKYGLNPAYRKQMEEGGFTVAGTGENGEARVLEIANGERSQEKRFYIATLFQPQLSSTPENPHVLIQAYLEAAKAFHLLRN